MSNNGTVNLKGKTYFTVARRVRDFRATHPISDGWGLSTSIIQCDESIIIFRAAITDPSGREVANGFAEERRSNRGVNFSSALENAETSALGRALAAAGLGGDGEYSSADELVNALSQQQPRFKIKIDRFTKAEPENEGAPPAPIEGFRKSVEELGVSWPDLVAFAAAQQWDDLSTWSRDNLVKLFGDIKAGNIEGITPKDGAA